MRAFVLSLSVLIVAGAACAQTATPEGAADLTRALQTYLGATDGVVAVSAAGAGYDVKIDFVPLMQNADSANASEITPLEFNLVETGKGLWSMTQDQAFKMSLNVPNTVSVDLSLGNLTSSGTFDAALGAFTTSSTTARDLQLTEKVTDAGMGQSNVSYSIAKFRYETSGKAAAGAGVDLTGTYALEGVSEVFSLPGMEVPLQLTAATATGSSQIDAMRPDAIYRLIAFFVANPSEAAIAAQQSTLKSMLGEAMPIFDHLSATSTMASVVVKSPVGLFGANEATVTVEANGLVEQGMFREALSVSGLKLPAGLAPDWASDLVTDAVALDFKVTNFNPAAGVKVLLDSIDLNDPQKSPDDAELMQAFLPDGEVTLTLTSGSMSTPIAALTAQGSLSFGAASLPNGKASVTLTGMTAMRQALTKAPPEVGMQMGPALGMAEGMAKKGDNGALVWDLEMTRAGAVLVNGVDMSALGGN